MIRGCVGDPELSGLDVVILAGGLGTRVRNVIPGVPKVLADISGKPFLGYLIGWLSDWGIERFILCISYRAEQIKRYLTEGKSFAKLEMIFSEEAKPRGTGGALTLAARHLRSEPVLVLNGDSFLGLPISDFIRFHKKHAADVTVAAVWMQDPSSYGALEIDSSCRIRAFREKVEAAEPSYINGGLYLFKRSMLSLIQGGYQSLEKDVLPQWVSAFRVMAFRGEFKFVDIGTPERYRAAQTVIPLYLGVT